MKWPACLLLLLFAANLYGQTNRLTLLEHIRWEESRNGQFMVGDNGRAIGHFHFHAKTWEDVTKMRRAKGLQVTNYHAGTRDLALSSAYALTYCEWIAERLTVNLGYASEQLIDASWNAGIGRVLRAKGDLDKLPRHTSARARKRPATRFLFPPPVQTAPQGGNSGVK